MGGNAYRRGGVGGMAGGKSPAEDALGIAEPEVFGPSKAEVKYQIGFDAEDRKEIDDRITEVFGRRISDQELASIVGAPDDAKVSLGIPWSSGFQVKIQSAGMEADRTVMKKSGKISIHNDIFIAKETGAGLGTRVLGRQVEQAAKLGIDKIETHAARSNIYNGYYSWPRLGYNAPIPGSVRAKLPGDMSGAKTVQDLMKTQSGREFWKTHGISTDMKFDLKPGSASRKVLSSYIKAKKSS